MKVQKSVMMYAWSVRHLFTNFANALRQAWKVIKLKLAMKSGQVSFKFKKVDGSIREAIGTLQVEYDRKGNGHGTEETMSFFDVEVNQWKSFKITNLI